MALDGFTPSNIAAEEDQREQRKKSTINLSDLQNDVAAQKELAKVGRTGCVACVGPAVRARRWGLDGVARTPGRAGTPSARGGLAIYLNVGASGNGTGACGALALGSRCGRVGRLWCASWLPLLSSWHR